MVNIADLLQFPDGAPRRDFISAFTELDAEPDSFTSGFELGMTSYFFHISERVTEYLGYPASRFLEDKDFSFFKSITPEKYLVSIFETQAKNTREAMSPDFDFKSPQILTVNAGAYHNSGMEVTVTQLAVPLVYSPDGMLKTLVAINLTIEREAAEFVERMARAISLLKRLKKIYVAAFPGKFEGIRTTRHNNIIPLYQPRTNGFKEPTAKEKEVLKLIALGYSTKEIAENLSSSFNTVETHRKHLLEKFEAKNTAELVQKASKVYWIE